MQEFSRIFSSLKQHSASFQKCSCWMAQKKRCKRKKKFECPNVIIKTISQFLMQYKLTYTCNKKKTKKDWRAKPLMSWLWQFLFKLLKTAYPSNPFPSHRIPGSDATCLCNYRSNKCNLKAKEKGEASHMTDKLYFTSVCVVSARTTST